MGRHEGKRESFTNWWMRNMVIPVARGATVEQAKQAAAPKPPRHGPKGGGRNANSS